MDCLGGGSTQGLGLGSGEVRGCIWDFGMLGVEMPTETVAVLL